ncbi:MAG TPA: 2-dehydropantoate 2-reductase N-terminal domain-containing protein, partial [Candidatus Omnitrophota bacterium]|nr:2-dehydropantoate 2-reductase N-terminal domain-containing protein [Candidatus Omnitrophota bacterium]
MKVLLYGGGAVGLGLASFLLKSGVSVDIIARPETAQALREKGLFRTGLFGDAEFSPKSFQVFSSLSEVKN